LLSEEEEVESVKLTFNEHMKELTAWQRFPSQVSLTSGFKVYSKVGQLTGNYKNLPTSLTITKFLTSNIMQIESVGGILRLLKKLLKFLTQSSE